MRVFNNCNVAELHPVESSFRGSSGRSSEMDREQKLLSGLSESCFCTALSPVSRILRMNFGCHPLGKRSNGKNMVSGRNEKKKKNITKDLFVVW